MTVSVDFVKALAARCASAIAEAYVEIRPGVGGWSKYYERKPNEVGIWGTACGMIALDLGERLGVTLTGADQLADMRAGAARTSSGIACVSGRFCQYFFAICVRMALGLTRAGLKVLS